MATALTQLVTEFKEKSDDEDAKAELDEHWGSLMWSCLVLFLWRDFMEPFIFS